MIRWRFVLTRLLIGVAVLMLLRWGLGPVVSYITVQGLQLTTGARAEIAETRVGLFPPRVQYLDVAVADPRGGKEMRDAFRAETIDLVIDGNALLHRRWVASDGRITGLQIGSHRETSGHFDAEPVEPKEIDAGPSMLSRLFGSASEKLGEGASAIANDLETARRSREIRQRWEADYEALVQRARQLEKQIRDVRDQARGIDNPLRDWPELQRTLAQAKEARNELMQVRQDIDSLPTRLQADLVSLDEAKRIDLQKVDDYVPGDLSQSQNFGVDLVAEAVRDQIDRLQGYLDSSRTLANYTVVAPESERIRGQTIDLVGNNQLPSMLIRHCEIGGLLSADGKAYTMTGTLENVTPTPELLREPTRARLSLDGPETMRVEYVQDRRGGNDVDLLTLHWPQMDAKPIQLGDRDDAGISIDGGHRELWVQIRSVGKQMTGRLVSKQTGVQLALHVDPKYAELPAAVSIRNSLAGVDRVEVDARFEGTWKDLDLNLNTSLAGVLRRAANEAVSQQLQASKEQLAAKIDEVHLEQSRQLRQWLGSRQSEARSLLASADASVEEMSQKVMKEVGGADAYLGRIRSSLRDRLR